MRLTGLLTTAAVLGFAGAASAGCFGAGHETTAEAEYTPIPTAEAEAAPELPALLLPLVDGETEEG